MNVLYRYLEKYLIIQKKKVIFNFIFDLKCLLTNITDIIDVNFYLNRSFGWIFVIQYNRTSIGIDSSVKRMIICSISKVFLLNYICILRLGCFVSERNIRNWITSIDVQINFLYKASQNMYLTVWLTSTRFECDKKSNYLFIYIKK